MRLSVRKDDPGYSKHAFGAKVLLDGVEVEQVFTADEEQGALWRYCTNDHGALVSDPSGKVPEECLTGVVQIIPGDYVD